jgi:hypothetical protein
METYRIIRVYENGTKKLLRRGLSLSEAQAHCRRAETSSSTTPRRADAVRWFDQYVRETHIPFGGGIPLRTVGLLESAIQEYNRVR